MSEWQTVETMPLVEDTEIVVRLENGAVAFAHFWGERFGYEFFEFDDAIDPKRLVFDIKEWRHLTDAERETRPWTKNHLVRFADPQAWHESLARFDADHKRGTV